MYFDPECRRVLLDCDDVLLDFLAGFRPFATEVLGLKLAPEGPGSFDLTRWLGVRDSAETVAIIRQFTEGEGTGFEDLPPIPGAVEAIRKLRSEGYRLGVITKSSAQPASRLRRIGNLERRFGEGTFDEVICLDLLASKETALRAQPPSIWIEDLPSNALLGLAAGHQACVLEAHHNGAEREAFTAASSIPWFRNWQEVTDAIFYEPAEPVPGVA
ncbi:hypothetical protein LAZ40_04295 [Cereibacter sphaeroides]|uniref:5' nucleotidase, NT5C type n=1 Tax=Cereibacter sphaeroides TaxID=1063 RepID=UPI001F44C452|nr:hypothetical protein [Cereibacter sphaeroides]MCE6958275.1 hypothetical protein [Cereibacter sphaeroides]MCE6971338.1 hypothetical protein [Cereibacter sphaeroides]